MTDFSWAKDLSDDAWAGALAGGDRRAPAMPDAQVQAMYVGSSGKESFREAAVFWAALRRTLADNGRPVGASTRFLDVGVGWGRLYRWALRDVGLQQITGIDVDLQAIELCRRTIPGGDFQHVPGEPYPFADGTFDAAFAYSVFSHLSEPSARKVLRNVARVLRPGATLAVTTLVPAHIDVWAGLVKNAGHGPALQRAKFDRTEWWSRMADGDFLYVPTGGGDASRPEDAYGEAVVPKMWWLTLDDYELIAYDRHSGLPQALVTLRRR
ncbi:MAG: class I SAM-dependent methyltransferase [Lautropia sp.]